MITNNDEIAAIWKRKYGYREMSDYEENLEREKQREREEEQQNDK